MFVQIRHTLAVYLYHFQWAGLFHEILSHHSHAGSHFEDGQIWACINSIGYAFGNTEVGQKVLTEVFLGSYLFHSCALKVLCKGKTIIQYSQILRTLIIYRSIILPHHPTLMSIRPIALGASEQMSLW